MKALLFLKILYEKKFSEAFVRKTSQQSDAAVLLQVIPSIHAFFSKKVHFFANRYEKHTVSEKWRLLCGPPRWQDVILAQLQTSYFTYTRHSTVAAVIGRILLHLSTLGVCLYVSQVSIRWQKCCHDCISFYNAQKVVYFNQRTKGLNRTTDIAKERLLCKRYREHLTSFFQKTKSTQTSGSTFAERFEQDSKTK